MRYLILIAGLVYGIAIHAQSIFESDPSKAEFITSDIPRFWEAFDNIDDRDNPFQAYLDEGSIGLNDFIRNRIESAKNLRKIVKDRREEYESKREGTYKVESFAEQMRETYRSLDALYPDAVFPPTYFVVGAFNSGGTSSENGLIIGVEKQNKIENIPYIVAHELIHFNQHYPDFHNTLLEQSIMEGSADFVGKLISGNSINAAAFEYGSKHTEELCQEFVEIMNDVKYNGWLYGSKGKKKGRPNDLGYWMGYKICEAYYAKANDPKEAIREILNITDFRKFLDKSGYLSEYMQN